MTESTINNEVTMSGAGATLLANRYRVVKQLGQGGMGSVWLAEDTKLDGHRVAIKMLPSILVSNKRAYAQVKQEALVSLKLTHTNIAAVRAFEEENGNPFLVMDYIDGQTLDDYLAEKGKLSEEETIRLLKPIASALDYAHAQGVVHRDVKPGNVMIRRDGVPFVLDFGIAREIQETMTRVTGKLSSGTLMYMSPEQLNGDAPKSAQDVYSFAVMAYECLLGHPPFVRGSIEDQIKHRQPDPLPGSSPVSQGVMAGLAKSAEARPPTCAAVLQSLAVGIGEKIPWVRLCLSGGVFLFLLAGAWLLASRMSRPPSGRGEAPLSPPASTEIPVIEVVPPMVETVVERPAPVPAGPPSPGSVPTPNELAKSAATKLKADVAVVRNGLSDDVRRLADNICRLADRQHDEGARHFAAGEYVAATNCWMSAMAKYEEARRSAEAELQRQMRESRANADQRAQLIARLDQGSQFLPDPPQRAAGTAKSIPLPDGSRMNLVWCPPGRFLMGSPPDEPKRESGESRHLVTLTKGFWIGQCEVTRDQWKAVMGNYSRFMLSSLVGADGMYPADEVSWFQCEEFCRRLSRSAGCEVRLPTEAEWEYACRAGTATPFSFGNALNGDRACCAGAEPYGPVGPGSNSYTGAARVGSYQRNPWGIYDMHGNVFEWCSDYYDDYPEGDVTDPQGPKVGQSRVRRGGCWNFYPSQCRSAFRSRWNPRDKARFTGFRICCSDSE